MLNKSERKTVIEFSDESQVASISTSSPRVAKKLAKAGLEVLWTVKEESGTSWCFQVDSFDVIVKPERTAIRLGAKSRI